MTESNTLASAGRVGRWLGLVPSLFAGAVLFALMAMTFADVILRSVFNEPIEAAPELTRLFMALIVFAALPVITWRGSHIVVDLFDPFFAPALARIRDVVINVACGVLLIWPAYRVWQLADRAKSYGDVTEYLNIPQHYIAYFIAVAAFLTAATFVVRGVVLVFSPGILEDQQSTPGEQKLD